MISKQEVENAQASWGEGVVNIGGLKGDREECEAYTQNFVKEHYDFDNKEVLFKPTKAAICRSIVLFHWWQCGISRR